MMRIILICDNDTPSTNHYFLLKQERCLRNNMSCTMPCTENWGPADSWVSRGRGLWKAIAIEAAGQQKGP